MIIENTNTKSYEQAKENTTSCLLNLLTSQNRINMNYCELDPQKGELSPRKLFKKSNLDISSNNTTCNNTNNNNKNELKEENGN